MGEVLNAFRHHWNLHSQETYQTANLEECSTPFGIIGIFTRHRRAFLRHLQHPKVLNAFRHHWNLHELGEAIGAPLCRAQRLSASLESSLVLDDRADEPTVAVLNAFRHHWNLHSRDFPSA